MNGASWFQRSWELQCSVSFTVLRHVPWNTFFLVQCNVFISLLWFLLSLLHMRTWFVCLRALVPTCFACLRAYVLTCQCVLLAFCAYVPTCSRDVTTNSKNRFSIICFPDIFVIVLSFSCQIKLLFLLLIPAFNECYDRLCK